MDSVGVNLAPAGAAAGWALAQRLEAAGIRHVRGPAATGPDDPALDGLRALAGADLRLDLVMGDGADPEATADGGRVARRRPWPPSRPRPGSRPRRCAGP